MCFVYLLLNQFCSHGGSHSSATRAFTEIMFELFYMFDSNHVVR